MYIVLVIAVWIFYDDEYFLSSNDVSENIVKVKSLPEVPSTMNVNLIMQESFNLRAFNTAEVVFCHFFKRILKVETLPEQKIPFQAAKSAFDPSCQENFA